MNIVECTSRKAASTQTAQLIEASIRATLEKQPTSQIAVSGGSTPVQCYEFLSQTDLAWARVNITLTDERIVPTNHIDSNTRMLKQHLIHNEAKQANFVDMMDMPLSEPFSAVLLGMGEDGHFASIFPDSAERGVALDTTNPAGVLTVQTKASVHSRCTFNLSALLNSSHIFLLAYGQVKREMIENPAGLPVETLLKQANPQIQIIWAP